MCKILEERFSFTIPPQACKVWAHFVHTVINNFSLVFETDLIISISKAYFQSLFYPSEMAEYNNVVDPLPIRQFPSPRVEIMRTCFAKIEILSITGDTITLVPKAGSQHHTLVCLRHRKGCVLKGDGLTLRKSQLKAFLSELTSM